jgi:hypothetical protein
VHCYRIVSFSTLELSSAAIWTESDHRVSLLRDQHCQCSHHHKQQVQRRALHNAVPGLCWIVEGQAVCHGTRPFARLLCCKLLSRKPSLWRVQSQHLHSSADGACFKMLFRASRVALAAALQCVHIYAYVQPSTKAKKDGLLFLATQKSCKDGFVSKQCGLMGGCRQQ